jgi:DNA replication protein DnaC
MKEDLNDDLLSRLESANQAYLNEQAKKSTVGCPRCKFRGYILVEDKAKNCECWFKNVMKRKMIESNIPEFYIGMTLEDNWYTKLDANESDAIVDEQAKIKIKRQVSQYIKNIVPLCAGLKLKLPSGKSFSNLIFIGPSQSGKTLLASIIAQEAIKKGLITVFINWMDLEPIFSDFDARDEQNQIIDKCKNADVVIIDGVYNLGLNNPYYLNGLERIASSRINKGQPTIITAFQDYSEIKAKYHWMSLVGSAYEIYLPAPKTENAALKNQRNSKSKKFLD